jgi:hypothetical protein
VKLRLLLGMLVVGMATACGGDGGGGGGGGSQGGGAVTVQLEEVNNSGKTGTAELQPGPASVDVTLEVKGGSDLDPIYVRRGPCDSPGEEVVHDIGFTTAGLGQGQIFETIENVATGEFVMTVEDDQTMKPIMCGVIPKQ